MAALDPRPRSVDTQTEPWRPAQRALPAPWAAPKALPLDVDFAIRQGGDRSLDPRRWDREMMEMCSRSGVKELKGSVKELVEPYGSRKRAAEGASESSEHVFTEILSTSAGL